MSRLKLAEEDFVVMSFPIATSRLPDNLTAAERQVVGLILNGLSASEIARQRKTALATVNKQLGSIYRKAGVYSLAELMAWMIEGGES